MLLMMSSRCAASLAARFVAGLPLQTRGAGTKRLDQPRDACKRIARGGARAFRSMEIGRKNWAKLIDTLRAPTGFRDHKDLFSETARKTPRSSDQRRRSELQTIAPLLPLMPAATPPVTSIIGRTSMSKRIALLSAAAFGLLAITSTIVAPARAEEKTVMVGGAAMFPSKNIIQNAVNSKDHTTLVAAVKAAGLVETLEGKGPFTVFAPTNAAFGKLPAGTVDNLVKPENKATLTKILTYHVVPGKLDASDLTDGKKLKTAEGEELTVKKADGKTWIVDAKGDTSMVTITNVHQSNGVIHVVDTVLMPSS
jgi:uncharacterized surface protein with fasciclin (FAS1) repeats